MIEGRHKKKDAQYQKTELYIISSDEQIEVAEPSGDSATIIYRLKDGQHGLFSREFRPPYVAQSGAKVIDLSMGIEDCKNKRCIWGLYDFKQTLNGKNDIIKLCDQWQSGLRYWYNSVLNNLDDYDKAGKIGVVTRTDLRNDVNRYIEDLEAQIEKSQKTQGTLVGIKNRVELEKKRAELKRFTDFRDGMFVYRDPKKNEEIWMFDVIESEHYQFVWEL